MREPSPSFLGGRCSGARGRARVLTRERFVTEQATYTLAGGLDAWGGQLAASKTTVSLSPCALFGTVRYR